MVMQAEVVYYATGILMVVEVVPVMVQSLKHHPYEAKLPILTKIS